MENQLESAKPASDDGSERQQHPPISKAAPWLVFPHGKGRKYQSFYNPCEPNNRNIIKSIPELQGRAYYHRPSHQGWLIVIGNVEDNAEYSVANSNLDDCFLWNPVSSQTIRLPKINRQNFSNESKPYFLYDLVLSSPPLSSTADFNPWCVVFLLFKRVNPLRNREHILLFCRPRDSEWRTKDFSAIIPANRGSELCIGSLLCFRGMLYAFSGSSFEDGWVVQIHIEALWHELGEYSTRLESQYTQIIKLHHADFTWMGAGEEFHRYTEHWVESGSEIFKVHLNCCPRGLRKVSSTHIFKLDFSSMTWVLLKTLGDHVLFLSSNMDTLLYSDVEHQKCYSSSTACCSAADMGLERGCLFYTLLDDQTLYTFEVEENATTVIMPCLKLPTPWFTPTWIMMPTAEKRHVAGGKRSITDLLVSQDTTETSVEEEKMSRLNIRGGELEALKQWDFLNLYESTEEISRFLHPVDYIHFRIACKQNSVVLPALNRISASTRATTTTYLSPWLISIFENNGDTICDIIDPMHNNDKYLMKLSDPLLVGAAIRFSKDGWLLLSDGKKSVFCYNPFTRAMICLPDLPDNFVLGVMSFSSVPTSDDCVVIAISNWNDYAGDLEITFLVTELGKSATDWSQYQFDYEGRSDDCFMPCMNNPVFYDGAFYCLDYNGLLGVFSMKGHPSWRVLSESLKQFSGFYPSYLVECDEKLLLVNLGQSGRSVDIYRLDCSEMIWVKLNSLGRHALFISYTSSFSAVPPRSCMENKIYFPRLYGERILYYSLDTCKYHFVGSDRHSLQDFHNTKERWNSTWIEPRWGPREELLPVNLGYKSVHYLQ